MRGKPVYSIMFFALFALILCACTACESVEQGDGMIFTDKGTYQTVNLYPLGWSPEQTSTLTLGKRVEIFIDFGVQNTVYADGGNMYTALVKSIPVTVHQKFNSSVSSVEIFKVVDYPYIMNGKYNSATKDDLMNALTDGEFYGGFEGISYNEWEEKKIPPIDTTNPNDIYKEYYADYSRLANYIGNDYSLYSGYDNLYIIASSFSSGEAAADGFSDFCDKNYSEVLYADDDMIAGVAGFISELATGGKSPYFVMVLGKREDVYEIMGGIDEANRKSFDDSEFFTIYIDQKLIKQDPESAQYAIAVEGDILSVSSCGKYCSCLIEQTHYLRQAQVYETGEITNGQIKIDLPYSLYENSSLDVCCQAQAYVSITKGQSVYTGCYTELERYGIEEGGISSEKYDYVFSKLGPLSDSERDSVVDEKSENYYDELNLKVPDDVAEQIVSIGTYQSKQTPFYMPFTINPENMVANMPYVVNITVDITLTVSNDILNYSNYTAAGEGSPFACQDMANIDVINQWSQNMAKDIAKGINSLMGSRENETYEFTKSVNFIIYKNEN